MRVLFTLNPGRSIFFFVVPLAWALRAAGHEVRIASQPQFANEISRTGLTAVPVGRNADVLRRMEAAGLTEAMLQAGRAGLSEPYDVVENPERASWDRLLRTHVEAVNEGYRHECFPAVAGAVEFARHWWPDLVIWEPFSYLGPIVAKACGAAHARILWGIDVFGLTRDIFRRVAAQQPPNQRADPLAEWLGSYARKYGAEFTEDMTCGQVTIDQFPSSLQSEANLTYLRMQYVPYGGAAVVPDWLRKPPARPRLALTMGLTATELFDGYTFDLQEVLDCLSELDIEVVATVTESEQRKLDRVPDNARLVPYVPLHALLPTCTVAVHHGGSATMATTARWPIPQLVLPYHFDEPIFARKLAAQGAGLELRHSRATGPAVRDAVVRLLHEPVFRKRAIALRDEIRALPTPNELVPQLEALAAAR